MVTGFFGHMNRSWRVSGASQKVWAAAEPLEQVAIAPVETDIAGNTRLQHLCPRQPLGFSAGKVAVVFDDGGAFLEQVLVVCRIGQEPDDFGLALPQGGYLSFRTTPKRAVTITDPPSSRIPTP